jgi:hypothetical protein
MKFINITDNYLKRWRRLHYVQVFQFYVYSFFSNYAFIHTKIKKQNLLVHI